MRTENETEEVGKEFLSQEAEERDPAVLGGAWSCFFGRTPGL